MTRILRANPTEAGNEDHGPDVLEQVDQLFPRQAYLFHAAESPGDDHVLWRVEGGHVLLFERKYKEKHDGKRDPEAGQRRKDKGKESSQVVDH